jgi:hypothetical protein
VQCVSEGLKKTRAERIVNDCGVRMVRETVLGCS